MVFESTPKAIGMIYAAVSLLTLAYLFKTGRFNTRIGYIFLAVSAALGFLIFAPMFPNQIQMLALGKTRQLGGSVALVAIGLGIFVVLTFAFGRMFCGHLCPIGAVQELLYKIPLKKLKLSNKSVFIILRIAFLAAIIVGAVVFSEGILAFLGQKEFFHFEAASAAFYVFLFLMIVSIMVYRPFCRLFCPYGVVLSLVSMVSLHRLRRNENCVDCGKCERVCPTNEAGATDLKQECYLCNRCREVCPMEAIEYSQRCGIMAPGPKLVRRPSGPDPLPRPETVTGTQTQGGHQ